MGGSSVCVYFDHIPGVSHPPQEWCSCIRLLDSLKHNHLAQELGCGRPLYSQHNKVGMRVSVGVRPCVCVNLDSQK